MCSDSLQPSVVDASELLLFPTSQPDDSASSDTVRSHGAQCPRDAIGHTTPRHRVGVDPSRFGFSLPSVEGARGPLVLRACTFVACSRALALLRAASKRRGQRRTLTRERF